MWTAAHLYGDDPAIVNNPTDRVEGVARSIIPPNIGRPNGCDSLGSMLECGSTASMARCSMDEDIWTEDDGNEDEEMTVPCPYCRRPIYEDSPHCPYCGNYIVEEDTIPARKPWWIILGTLLVLYVVYRWTVG